MRRLRRIPSPRATSSMIALSVSTSASVSPFLMASPSFFSHLTRRPSSIVGERASMKTFVAIGGAPNSYVEYRMSSRDLYSLIEDATRHTRFDIRSVEVHDFSDRRDRLRRVGLGCFLEILRVRHRHIGLVDANHRRV